MHVFRLYNFYQYYRCLAFPSEKKRNTRTQAHKYLLFRIIQERASLFLYPPQTFPHFTLFRISVLFSTNRHTTSDVYAISIGNQ